VLEALGIEDLEKVGAFISMIYRMLRRALRPVKRLAKKLDVLLFGELHDYLDKCRGVIHVGANVGQERNLYADRGLAILWIEPIPNVFATLVDNIREEPRQRAINALLLDKDDVEHVFHVASNDGASSSIFDFHMHGDIWPEISYVADLRMRSSTLPSVLKREGVEPSEYDALVLDTQGSELLVLRGAEPILSGFRYIQTEAADFESYRDGALASQITSFMKEHGFVLSYRQQMARHQSGGTYYELLFKNRNLR
jgi:FkbM family methyltransferase